MKFTLIAVSCFAVLAGCTARDGSPPWGVGVTLTPPQQPIPVVTTVPVQPQVVYQQPVTYTTPSYQLAK